MTGNAQTMRELADPLKEPLQKMVAEFSDYHYDGCPADNNSGACECYAGIIVQRAKDALAALPPSQEVPDTRFEKTTAGVIDWKMEADRANRLLAACENAAAAAQPQRMWSAPAEFVMWALMEGAWQGADVDGGASQDKAVELGLIVATQYDPEKHAESYCEPGDQWFVPSESLLAALSGKPGAEPQRPADALRLLAGLFSESLHETWTRGEIVNVIEDAIRLGSPHPRPNSATDVRLTHSTADGSIHSGFSGECRLCSPPALSRPESQTP